MSVMWFGSRKEEPNKIVYINICILYHYCLWKSITVFGNFCYREVSGYITHNQKQFWKHIFYEDSGKKCRVVNDYE